jgi:folate-binding protein YgfZ
MDFTMECAPLTRYGLLSVTGADARAFLHAQLTNDIENLTADRSVFAGWCTAKGRLLATMRVIPASDGFLLQVARDLVPMVLKRLSMFILRSKVKIADESARAQTGVWNADWQGPDVAWQNSEVKVRVGERRFVVIGTGLSGCSASEETWTLEEIRAGRPLITAATQDMFVPQMVNLEKIGGVDFQKGCYPGQEIVARAQYRGEVKRRMVRLPAPAGAHLKPGEPFNGGTVVDAAGGELLAVMPV